jgi:hypothetical protein
VNDIRCVGSSCNNNSVEDILYSQNTKFKAAFDVNGDGLGDNRDLFLLANVLLAAPTAAFGLDGKQAVLNSYADLLLKRGDVNSSGTSDALDMVALYSHFGAATWTYDMNVDGVVNVADVATMITNEFRTKAGDFDLDGDVDGADNVLWRKSVGTGTQYTQGDANLDGVVNGADLAVWRTNFGFVRQPLSASSGSGASRTAVPEPGTSVLLCAAIAASVFMWRDKSKKHCNFRQILIFNDESSNR